MEQFVKLKIIKVNNLATLTLEKAAKINLNCSNSSAKLHQAFQVMTKNIKH